MPFLIRPFGSFSIVFSSLITLLLLSNGPAYAEWVAVSYSESSGGFTVYVDPETIRHKGSLVKMWVLLDVKTAQTGAGISFSSKRMHEEYDCVEERKRTLALTLFSANMARGDVVLEKADEEKWEPVAPGTVNQVLWKHACGKQ